MRINCPYCNEETKIEMDGDNWIEECLFCEKQFEVIAEVEITYTASEILYEICIECGKTYIYNGNKFPRPEKYKNIELKQYNLCEKCYWKLIECDRNVKHKVDIERIK